MTDPGYSFFHPDVNMFDPGPEDRMGNMMKLVRALDHRCDDTCQVLDSCTAPFDFVSTCSVRTCSPIQSRPMKIVSMIVNSLLRTRDFTLLSVILDCCYCMPVV